MTQTRHRAAQGSWVSAVAEALSVPRRDLESRVPAPLPALDQPVSRENEVGAGASPQADAIAPPRRDEVSANARARTRD